MLVVFILAGNLLILLAFGVARLITSPPELAVEGIDHLRPVTPAVWRGNAPSALGYAGLAEHGVTAVVDLRAERDLDVDVALLEELGLERTHIPIRDGQVPTARQVARFFEALDQADGRVYVHCGAGVGRAGTMSAALLVASETASPAQALLRNLSVGPPSLEQIVFVLGLDEGVSGEVPRAVTALSRLWDGPRRVYTTYLRQAWSD